VLRLVVQSAAQSQRPTDDNRAVEPIAEALGVNLYAKQLVDGRDRPQLERLCRYVMRPPLSQERLEWRTDGRLELTLKNVWKDGTRALVLEPFDLLVRLCSAATVPTSRRSRWGWLLRHVFRADVDTCSLCGGPMRWLEAATQQTAIAKHGLAPQPPPEPRASVPLGQLAFSFG
jgi:hypothetical protein